jgi:predicted nucleic acid-binding protein
MTAAALDCVVDASVGIKLFVAESLSDEAHALFSHLADDPPARLHVPDLFYIECADILSKVVRRLGLAEEDARLYVEQLGGLALRSRPTAELAAEALDIALAYDITAYDAAYVALSASLGVPLFTADERLARALAATPFDVRWMGAIAMPLLPGA